MKKFYDPLENFIKNENIISIKRENLDESKLVSIPVKMSKKLLLVKYWYDFLFDGYKIIRIRDITEIKQEMVIEEIHKREKITTNSGNITSLDIDGWQQIFKWMFSLDIIVIIECERINEIDFYIGRILDVRTKAVKILHFDGEGKWDENKTVIKYQHITCVSFYCRYIKFMSRYVACTSSE
jgi:hypothetical protein